ncbi:MAG TPA: hypothetical protein VJA21_07115 [Verrucomicrobiae bacterium]
MNARPKVIGGYIAGWVLVIFFVLLLTLIFNFVGTIICAALAGMMLGAARLRAWQSLALSAVFPGVISTFLLVTKAELPATQIVLLSLICFGIFWLIYVAVWALVRQEASQPAGSSARPATGSARPGRERGLALMRQAAPGSVPLPGQTAETVLADSTELTLEVLQGDWFARNSNPAPSDGQKAIVISKNTLVLSLTDANGRVCSRSKAYLRLCPGSVLALDDHTGPVDLDPEAQVSI